MEQKTAFLDTFGDSPILKVLDFLIVNEDFDYSKTEIANLSGVGYSTLKLFFGKLESQGMVVKVREVGKAKMFKLNIANPIIKKFRGLYWETAKQRIRKKAKIVVTENKEI